MYCPPPPKLKAIFATGFSYCIQQTMHTLLVINLISILCFRLVFFLAHYKNGTYKHKKIAKCDLQGRNLPIADLSTHLESTYNLAIDLLNKRIYATRIHTSENPGSLFSLDYNGNNLIYHHELSKSIQRMKISRGKLYIVVHQPGVDKGLALYYNMSLPLSNISLNAEDIISPTNFTNVSTRFQY